MNMKKPYMEWKVTTTPSSNDKIFEEYNYQLYMDAKKKYENLSTVEKGKYKGADAYIEEFTDIRLSHAQKNYKRIIEENNEQLYRGMYHDVLPIDLYMQDNEVIDLLSSLENEKYIKDIYCRKKLKVSGGLNTLQTTILIDCLRQGRSLLQSGRTAEMLSKPLIDFYAASAYAYAIIVINSPLHKSIDSLKGSHGHTYNHENGTIDFGGDIPAGTFLDLLLSMPIMEICSGEISFKLNLLKSLEFVQEHKISISLITLLSMVPELQEQYRTVDNDQQYTYPLQISTKMENMKVKYIFKIGDGKNIPADKEKLKKCFNQASIREQDGKIEISVANDAISEIMPMIYQDIYGKLWYIDSAVEGVVLPEICLHFLIISALCNIMRYSPNEWNDILFNKISSEFSLLIRKYLRLFEQKFPMLVTQYLTNYIPVLSMPLGNNTNKGGIN